MPGLGIGADQDGDPSPEGKKFDCAGGAGGRPADGKR